MSEQRNPRRYPVELTRDEIIRLAGATRENAEFLDERRERTRVPHAEIGIAQRLHARAAELYDIADRCRS